MLRVGTQTNHLSSPAFPLGIAGLCISIMPKLNRRKKPRPVPPDKNRCCYVFPGSDAKRAGQRCKAARSSKDPEGKHCYGHALDGALARADAAEGGKRATGVRGMLREVESNRAGFNRAAQAEYNIYTMEDVFTLLCGELKYYSDVKPDASRRIRIIDMMITCRKSLLNTDNRAKEVKFVNTYGVRGNAKKADIPEPFPSDTKDGC